MTKAKKLIEVAMPIKEISAEVYVINLFVTGTFLLYIYGGHAVHFLCAGL